MKPAVTLVAAIAAMSGLSGCQPDQEFRLAEACRESVTYIAAPTDDALEKSCSCLAKAAVQQLDRDTVEFMIAMFEDPQRTMLDSSPGSIAKMETVTKFQLKNAACMTP